MAKKRIRKKWASKFSCCPLCGDPLPDDPRKRVIGSSGRAICSSCLNAAQKIHSSCKQNKENLKDLNDISPVLTPREIHTILDKSIIGQEEAKRAISVAFWKQQLRRNGADIPNASLLLYGPTGCGKTALLRAAASAVNLPFISFDSTTLSEAGYRGRDAADMVQDLANTCKDKKMVTSGIIFVDEVDKLAALKGNPYRAAYSRGTQHSLLKLIEGTDIDIEGNTISTGSILFLFGGAFSGLTNRREKHILKNNIIGFDRYEEKEENLEEQLLTPEDFIGYGMEPELMGRVGRCVPLHALNETQMKQILLESDLSVYRKYQAFFQEQGQDLSMDEKTMKDLIRKAMERSMGARGLNALVEEWMESRLARLAEGTYE